MIKYSNFTIIILCLLFLGCSKDSNPTDDQGVPALIVETLEPSYTGGSTATLNGKIDPGFSFDVIQRGFVYSTSPNPTTADNVITVDGTTGNFSGDIYNLTINTDYNVKAFMIYSEGTVYGETKQFTTGDNNYIFTKDFIWRNTLHSKPNDLIYIFHSNTDMSGAIIDLTVSAFNYNTATIVAELLLENTPQFQLYPFIGTYTGNSELYIADYNVVKILNPNLDEIERINIPLDAQITNVVQKNNLLFISTAFNTAAVESILVYDRSTLTLLSQEDAFSTLSGLSIYPKANSNNLICVGFTRSTSGFNTYEYEYTPDGMRVSWQGYSFLPAGGSEPLRSHDAAAFIIKGQYVFPKADLTNYSTPLNNGLNIEDSRFSDNADVLYTIQRNSLIEIYDTTNFNLTGTIATRPAYTNRSLFVDANEAIILHWDFNPNFPAQLFYSKYQL